MKLLNSKKVLDCNESEELIHHNEITKIIDTIYKMRNMNCALVITDSNNKEPKIVTSKLHEIFDCFEYFDMKNGIDVYQDNDFLTFVLNGQTYEMNEEINIFYTFIKVLLLDASGNVIHSFVEF